MKKTKYLTKILSILLCVVLLCTFGATAALAEEAAETKTFTVRFLVNEAELAEYTQQVSQGSAIPSTPPAPAAKEGTVFAGWQDTGQENSPLMQDFSSYTVEKDVAFSAVFSPSSEEAAPQGPASAPEGTPAADEPAAEKPAEEEPEADGGEPITNYHTVTFVPDNDTAEAFTQIVEDGKLSNQPAPPVPNRQKRQTAFIGWFLPDADQPFDFLHTPITEDITLTAQYIENYLVKYKSAPGGEELVIDSIELSPTDTVPQTSVVIAPPENSFLEYWYVEGESEEVPFIFGQTTTRDLTLIPRFSNQFYVFFISEGTQVPFASVTGGNTVEQPDAPTRMGYIFSHWALEKNSATAFDFSTPISTDTTLYAVWTPEEVPYTIVYWLEKPNVQGDPGGDIQNYGFYNAVPKSGMAGTNISFTQASQLDTIPYAAFSHSTPTVVSGTGTTVVNVYFKRNVYTFEFQLYEYSNSSYLQNHTATLTINGQTYTAENPYRINVKLEQDVSAIWPSSPNSAPTQTAEIWENGVKTGIKQYSFTGWDPFSLRINQYWVTRRLTVTSDMLPTDSNICKLSSLWASSSITQNVNYWFEKLPGETGVERTYNGVDYILSNDYSQSIQTSNTNLIPKTISGVTNVAAQNSGNQFDFFYNRIRYSLAFNTKGGSSVSTASGVMFNQSLLSLAPAAPTKEGYTFSGWYLDDDYYTPFDFASNPQMPNSNLTVFAKWTSTQNTIRLYSDMGNQNLLKETGCETNAYLQAPLLYEEGQVVEGKGVFDGWYVYIGKNRTAKFSFETPITGDLDLHAAWKTNGFTVTYTSGEGGGTPPVDKDTYYLGKQARLADGSTLTPPAGYDFFVYWRLVGDPSSRHFYPATVFPVYGNAEFVPEYGKNSEYVNINYHANYPDATDSVITWKVKRDDATTLAGQIFSYPNSSIIGWSTSPTAQTPEYPVSSPDFPTGSTDSNLYAVWKFNGYTILFEAETGGTLPANAQTSFAEIAPGSLWGDVIAANVPVPKPNSGYYFKGWEPALPSPSDAINQSQTYRAIFAPKGSITLRANNATVQYNGGTQTVSSTVDLVAGTLLPGHTLTATAQGTGKDVGTYPANLANITLTDEQGTPLSPQKYYNIATASGIVNITPAPASVAAQNTGKIYGSQDPALTASVTGAMGTDVLNYTVARAKGENAGEYPIEVTLGENPNYTVTSANGLFTIAPKTVDVLVTPLNISKVYGQVDPTLTATVAGLVGNDKIAYTLKRQAGEGAGSYRIEVEFGNNPNYVVQATQAVFTITPAPATIALPSLTKVAGQADPAITPNVTGLVGKDQLTYTVTRTPGETPGSYSIVATVGTNPNYSVTVTNGVLTITPAPVPPPSSSTEPGPAPASSSSSAVRPASSRPAASSSSAVSSSSVPASSSSEETTSIADSTPPAGQNGGSQTTLSEGQTPLGGLTSSNWSLMNLILAIFNSITALALLVGIFTARKKNEQQNTKERAITRLLSLIPAAASLLAFFLLENLGGSMVFINKWTILMVGITLVQVIVTVLSIRKKHNSTSELV